MATETTIRIYIGGLGETVTAEDLRNTFSKMGVVEAVDIVRTKGRSFAYINFLPSSDKSLAKLFSTYNGCSWKGGKLRLEKAKQHYLDRLRAEWAEEAELANKKRDDEEVKEEEKKKKSIVPQVGHKRGLDVKDKQIRLFFPKLRKVKSLPYSGTGKHKYSFQRVEAPSLPCHFCDCVEHSDYLQTSKAIQIHHDIIENGGINEDEINMMNSVMNKLFERESILKASPCPLVSSRVDVEASPNDQNHEDDVTDEDNIVINTKVSQDDESLLLESLKQQQTGSTKKVMRSIKSQNSNDELKQNELGAHSDKPSRKKTELVKLGGIEREFASSVLNGESLLHNSKEKPESSAPKEESVVNRSLSRKRLQWNALVDHKDNIAFTLSSLISGGQSSKDLEEPDAHAPPVPSDHNHNLQPIEHAVDNASSDPVSFQLKQGGGVGSSDKPARGASWAQKSSWMQLVNGSNNGAFSISQILTGMNSQKNDSQTPRSHQNSIPINQSDLVRRNRIDDLDSEKEEEMSAPYKDMNMGFLSKKKNQNAGAQVNARECIMERVVWTKTDRIDPNLLGKRGNFVEKRSDRPTVVISDTCRFMRSDSSLQEWKTTKEALSRSLKKKKE